MTFEIKVLTWDMNKEMAGLNPTWPINYRNHHVRKALYSENASQYRRKL